ncbi:MAG: T9SS type A sorting domain-containing protein [Crocinitomicaceae bacterium]
MKTIFILSLFAISFPSFGQTWSGEIASIFYEKCTKCHNSNGIAPFSLTTFAEASPMAAAIYDAVNEDRMPPWPPNNNYQQYVHNRALSSTQKTSILNWLTAGAPEGNSSATPPPPIYSSSAILGNGDLTLQIPNYMSKALSGHDDYVCFVVPSGLTQNRVIKAIEIIPGNRQIVHHALIYIDPDNLSATDTIGGDCAAPGSANATLVTGYTPGSTPMTLPTISPMKLGIPFPAGSDIVFAMHYPDGSYGEWDSTKVIFHFYPVGETGIRQVYAAPMIQNWSFGLPANQFTNVTAQYPAGTGTLTSNVSVLSAFPHMHLIGESIKSYGIGPLGDSIPLIDIPHWDFHWQDFYFFKHIQKLPIGSKVKAEGRYNNTTSNVHNPNNPPVYVGAGLNTSDEMFLVYYHFMAYQTGDELVDMEALMTAGLTDLQKEENGAISVYPNPSNDEFRLKLPDYLANKASNLRIYDYQGKLVRNWSKIDNTNNWIWDGKDENGNAVKKGIYMLSANIDGTFYSCRMIKN